MISFRELYAIAELHKGKPAIDAALPEVLSIDELAAQSDAFCLSTMTRRIFRAGLKHSVIDAKWPAFEAALSQFNPLACAYMSDDKLEELMSNKALIRHMGKMKAIRVNAAMVVQRSQEAGSFGRYLADWPGESIIELWLALKKDGAQLGGMSGARFLRMVGKDTFLLTDDVVAVLKAQQVITKAPTSQRDMRIAQQVFNDWQSESGLPLAHISRIASMAAANWQ